MLRRILRSLIAFAAIVAAYKAYFLLAVPWMEPPIARKESTHVTSEDVNRANQAATKYQRLLANYFPKDHWSQLRPPKVIAGSNEQMMLVLDDYDRHDDGRVEIQRFAVLIFPTALRDGVAPRDAIVLEAPQGAKLQFDVFRPERGEIGRITRGEFPGPITIRSDMQEPGPEDDLLVETADLSMNTKLLYSSSPVRFRMGRNVGGGSELEIRFMDDDHSQAGDSGLKFPGIEGLEIRRDVRARLFLGADNLLPGDKKTRQATSEHAPDLDQKGKEKAEEPAPVEVTCSGPFVFDAVRYVAGFDRDVELRQISANGPSDQLSAQQLDIHFVPRQEAGAAAEPVIADPVKRQLHDIGRLEPAAVVAQGHPVVVNSPTRQAEARGGRVQLGLRDRRVVISGGSDVKLTYGPNILCAPAIEYQHPASDAATQIGRFRATGPGSLDYVFDPQKPEQKFKANWQTSVELNRYQGQPVLTLVGRPQMGVAKMGALEADRIQVFVRELEGNSEAAGAVPLPGELGGNGKLQIAPDRLAASGRVEIESRELTGNTEELLVAFRVEPAAAEERATGAAADGAAKATSAAGGRGGGGGSMNLASRSEGQQQYHIDTDRLRVQVAVRGEKMSPTNLSCDGNVVFSEIPLAATAEKPLEVRGGQLTVDNLDSDMHVTILSAAPGQEAGAKDAQVSARGMTVLAGTVQLDQRENRMWIEGPGKANMLVSRDLAGKPSATSYPLDITWRGGLNFNGQFVLIDNGVVVQGADDWVHCNRLTARLNKNVKFGEHIDQKAIDLAEIECQGQVLVDHRSRDELGLASHERMKLERISINQQTGDISGDGPGEIRSTHFSDQMNMLAGPTPGGKPQPAPVTPPPGVRGGKLHFLRVDFQRALSGNMITRELRFQERVRTVYGPVDSWEQELDGSQLESLPLDSMTLACDELALNEDPQVVRAATNPNEIGKRKMGPVQMRAKGNVKIDGRSESEGRFGAQADSASFDQLKDVYVLEGSDRAPAMLWRRQSADDNSPPMYAKSIRYNRKTGELSGRFKTLEYVQPEAPQSARGPAPQTR